MRYTDLVFDLYGTLIDIHTEKTDLVWEKTALFFGLYGAHYTPKELKDGFQRELARRKEEACLGSDSFPDIPYEQVMGSLFRAKGVENGDALGFHATQLLRVCSMDYIRLYPDAKKALGLLRQKGFRIWLLSNAQRAFTAYELRLLEMEDLFDGIYLSSDYGCVKPDERFYRALLQDRDLDPGHCLMIGNDRQTDIAGARKAGMATLYMHTALTPSDQAPADPALHPAIAKEMGHWEYEGDDWFDLVQYLR